MVVVGSAGAVELAHLLQRRRAGSAPGPHLSGARRCGLRTGPEQGRALAADGTAASLPQGAAPVVDALHVRKGGVFARAGGDAHLTTLDPEHPLPSSIALQLHAKLHVHLIAPRR
jgi:hypothetical protein